MLKVAITGRSGSGKSSVSKYYASLGYPVSDGDEVSRLVTQPGTPCLAELADAFGSEIINEDGTLARKKLAAIAFVDPQKNQLLIDITHPHILDEFKRREENARRTGARLFFVDGAVIVGGPAQSRCDKLIVVVAESHLSVSRIILRDGISKTAAYNRLAAQQPVEVLLKAADYVIENNGSEKALYEKADAVLAALLQDTAEAKN